jgi:hypothetical protein
MFVKLYPHIGAYAYHNGKLVFRLKKDIHIYVYGLPQVAFHFHKHLSESMQQLGFTRLKSDRYIIGLIGAKISSVTYSGSRNMQIGWFRVMSGGCGSRCEKSGLVKAHHLFRDV